MNKPFRITPLPTEVAEAARRVASQGRPNHKTMVAESGNAYPCRHCLAWAVPGEEMILFPYQSIPEARPYGESGPIFVHKVQCEQYSTLHDYPDAFRKGRVVRGYNEENEIIAAEVPARELESVFQEMLSLPEISFLQVRSVTHGCYTMKVERA